MENIVKRYGDFEAVKDVSFSVAEGEIFGLLGPNGAGKSTLIRMMTTLIPITAGRAFVAGHDVAKDPDAVRRMIGVIPQALTSDPDLTVEENLNIYAKLYGVPQGRAREEHRRGAGGRGPHQVARRADQDPLRRHAAPRWKSPAAWCTIRRSSFSTSPPPAWTRSRASPSGRCSTSCAGTRELTMLITTHYMDEADKLCDRIAIVDHGKLVALGTPIELKHSVPGANVIEVHFDRETEEWQERLDGLTDVTSVQAESAGFYRVLTSSGSKTTMQLVELAAELGETLTSLSVQNTTLDDVFVHYTGRQLRDEQVKPPGFVMPPRPGVRP